MSLLQMLDRLEQPLSGICSSLFLAKSAKEGGIFIERLLPLMHWNVQHM